MKKLLALFFFLFFCPHLIMAGGSTKPNVVTVGPLSVNTYTGNLFYSRNDMYLSEPGLDMDITFSYNSGETKYDYGYGGGWTHTLNVVYEKIGSNICVKRWDGNRDTFTLSGSVYTPPVGCFDSLTQYEPGKFRLRTKGGVVYSFNDSSHKKLTGICDRNGNCITMIYSHGRPTSLNNVKGRYFTISWSGSRMTQITDYASRSVYYRFDAEGNPIQVDQGERIHFKYEYDDSRRLVRVIDPREGVYEITYNDAGAVTRVQSPLSDETFTYDTILTKTTHTIAGLATVYRFDSLARVIDIAGVCCGSHNQFKYDANNNITAVIDAKGQIKKYTYGPNGDLLTATDNLNYTVSFTWDSVYHHVKSRRDRDGNTATYTDDPTGNCTDIRMPTGITEHYSYNSYGQVTSYTDGCGNTTTFTYDENGYPAKVTYPIGSESFTYDNVGNILTYTDANGNTIQNTYDALDRLITTTNALSEQTSYTYDDNGNVVSVSYPDGNVINYTYDALNRVTQVTDGIGIVQTNSFDNAGNLISSIDGNGIVTTHTYDSQNRLTSTTRDGITQTYTYDANGNIQTSNDGNGQTTTYIYDAQNRVLSASVGGVTSTTAYDPNGNVIRRTDGTGNIISYAYDGLDRLIQEIFPDGSSKDYTYDCNNNVISRTDNNGDVTTYIYDANNRLTKRDFPGSNDDNYTYDAGGRMLTANNNDASITYTYDGANRVLNEVLNGHTTAHAYNIAARQRTITYPGGSLVQETRNLRDRLVSISQGGVNVSLTYDPGSRLSNISYGSNLTSTYGYNGHNLVTALTHTNGSNLIAGFNYTYDNADNRLVARDNHDSTRSEMYSYNSLYSLTTAMRGKLAGGTIPSPINTFLYGYDNVGNWTSVSDGGTTTYTSDNLNQYTSSSSGGDFGYDWNGNMLTKVMNHYVTFSGWYDYENRLVGVDSSTHKKGFYKYDALGRRIQKKTPSDTINYYYDGVRVIEERASDNTVTATYLYGSEWIDDVIGMTRDGATYFYLKNALGSVVAMTNSSGSIMERYEYNPFGYPKIWDSTYTIQRASSIIGNRLLFTGREYDAEIGLYNYRARHYDPTLGRFLQRDPIGVWGDAHNRGNGYGYVSNGPVSYIDPMGQSAGEPVPGAELFVEQEPGDKPIAVGNPEPHPVPPDNLILSGGQALKLTVPIGGVYFPCANIGPYSQSLSNIEDNGIAFIIKPYAKDLGTHGLIALHPSSETFSKIFSGLEGKGLIGTDGGSGTTHTISYSTSSDAAQGSHPVDFVGAAVGDPSICFTGGSRNSIGPFPPPPPLLDAKLGFSTVNSYGITEDGIK